MGEYNIGEFIYRSRKAIGLTQEDLCHDEEGYIYFSVETLSRVEHGKQRPNYRTMREIMKRLGKENCFCGPYLKTEDYQVLEMHRELKQLIAKNNHTEAERLLGLIEKRLSLQYVTNRQYLIRTHALLDLRQGRITEAEALKLLEEALRLTVHSYGTELFSYEVLLPEEIVIVCNIADCYGMLGHIEKALELMATVMQMLKNETTQSRYPEGLIEMLQRNRIRWLGKQGKHEAAIEQLDNEIQDCIQNGIAITIPGLFYARAYNFHRLKQTDSKWKDYDQHKMHLNFAKCALLAELFCDEGGKQKALAVVSRESK